MAGQKNSLLPHSAQQNVPLGMAWRETILKSCEGGFQLLKIFLLYYTCCH